MKKATCKILVGAMAAVLMACAAEAGVVGTFGDFTVFDSGVDTGVTFFDSGSNPSPFPAPVTMQISATWPAPSSSLTVGQMQTYLSGQGLPPNTFLVLFKKAVVGTSVLQDLSINIGVVAVATGTGTFPMSGTGVFAFDGNIDLTSYSSSDAIQVSYALNCQSCADRLDEIDLAGLPEPISMAFLGTGFVGMLLSRIRKRKE